MKKYPYLLATIFCACGLAMGTGSVLSHGIAARAEGEIPSFKLLLPNEAEEYIALDAPTSISHGKDLFVIADGDRLFLYRNADKAYTLFQHSYNRDARQNVITQVVLASNGKIYFTDTTNFLFRLDPDEGKIERTELNCNAFCIDGNDLYYATTNRGKVLISKTDLTFSAPETVTQYGGTVAPAMYADGKELYYVDRDVLHAVNAGTSVSLPIGEKTAYSLSADGKNFYLVTLEYDLYLFDLDSASLKKEYHGGYYSVECYDSYAYAVNGNRVERFLAATGERTLYEISSASHSEGRLSRASDAVVVGKNVYLADDLNHRITLLDEKGNYSASFETENIPYEISADEKTVLVNSGSMATVYDVKGNLLYTCNELSNGETFVSSVNVYGVYYLVTATNSFCKIWQNADGDYTFERISKGLNAISRDLATDVYGNIYLYLSDHSVYRFHESEFIDPSASGSFQYRFPLEINDLTAAYDGTLYGLNGNRLFSSDESVSELHTAQLVYGEKENLVGFTIGYSSNTLYALNPTFLAKTEDIALPNLNDISFGSAADKLFQKESTPLSVVEISENAIVSTFDLSAMKESSRFPYLGTKRLDAPKQAILLSETDLYNIVALFDNTTHRYQAAFLSKESCTLAEEGNVLHPSLEFSEGYAFTSSEVDVLKYPFYFEDLSLAKLPRGKKVLVLGELSLNGGEDLSYRYVSVELNGKTVLGYLPANFLIHAANTSDSYTYISTGYIYTKDKTIAMTSQNGTVKHFSTALPFDVIGDPYAESEVTISYTEADGTTYYAAVSSELFKTNKQRNLRKYVIVIFGAIAVILVTDYFILRKKKEPDPADDSD